MPGAEGDEAARNSRGELVTTLAGDAQEEADVPAEPHLGGGPGSAKPRYLAPSLGFAQSAGAQLVPSRFSPHL